MSVTFGHLFRSLFEYTEHSINFLITNSFGSDKEHTIATDMAAPARGTKDSFGAVFFVSYWQSAPIVPKTGTVGAFRGC